MHPNPGLSTTFNRILETLDSLLPKRSRKGDFGAQILQAAISNLQPVNKVAVMQLEEFVTECESFRSQQFWRDEGHPHGDTAACWLHRSLP